MLIGMRELLQAFMLTSSVNEGAFQQVLPRAFVFAISAILLFVYAQQIIS